MGISRTLIVVAWGTIVFSCVGVFGGDGSDRYSLRDLTGGCNEGTLVGGRRPQLRPDRLRRESWGVLAG